MTTVPRRSPKLSRAKHAPDLCDAIAILDDLLQVPIATPLSGDDGFEGQVKVDATRLYVYVDGAWRYLTLTAL